MTSNKGMWQYLMVVILSVCGVSCSNSTKPPVAGETGCSSGAVASSSEDPCSRQYLRCDNQQWQPSMCVAGIINKQTGQCVPNSEDCPDPGVTVRTFTSRTRRQAPSAGNCLRFNDCPADLKNIFIYPDWENPECDSYIVCAGGSQLLSTCKRDGYSFYNPIRLSCEDFASSTNMCVHRLNTIMAS